MELGTTHFYLFFFYEKRSHLVQLRQIRLDINKIQDELNERAEDEEEKDTSDETEGEGSTDSKSEDDEAGDNSQCESIASIDYEFPEDKNEAKAVNKGKPIDENTEKAEYNVV